MVIITLSPSDRRHLLYETLVASKNTSAQEMDDGSTMDNGFSALVIPNSMFNPNPTQQRLVKSFFRRKLHIKPSWAARAQEKRLNSIACCQFISVYDRACAERLQQNHLISMGMYREDGEYVEWRSNLALVYFCLNLLNHLMKWNSPDGFVQKHPLLLTT